MTTLAAKPKAYRLPTHVLPRRYDIQLDARLGRDDFFGRVTVQLDIKQPQDFIELNQRELQLSNARLTFNGETLEGRIEQDDEREMARIQFDRALPVGEGTLEVDFRGKVGRGLEGLYLAKDGPEQCLCTQCEEAEARAIFPCWDEPTFKARFAWQVTTSPDVVVLANGPLVGVTDSVDGQSKTWKFAPTKPMSSYLVALVIGDMASTPEEVVNGTPIRVWALRGKEHMGRFAHDFTKRVLPWYEDYFGAPYHFDKYDQAAVPGFGAGAMENVGLVLYRQSALIMDPRTASWQAEKRIAHVVAHETAHMWFGNLVTMKWWDDLWLNEAFAEWVSTKALDDLNPEYRVWDDFMAAKNGAMADDSLESTHPIYNPVDTPAEAAEMFDSITYEKGCAVLRMLEGFLGEERFREGIRTYMKEFAESNAAGADLWRHLQAASDQPVTALMESWIAQGGYPVVSVAVQGSGPDTALRLGQRRFFSTPNAPANEQIWYVPVVARYEDDEGVHEARYLLTGREGVMPLSVSGTLRWCYANAGEVGFYRQHPDEQVLKGILANLSKLSPAEQVGLLNDQWALLRSGATRIGQFLDVLAALTAADDYTVLGAVVSRLYSIESLLEEFGDEEALNRFRAWVKGAFEGKMAGLGYEPTPGESRNQTQSRVHVLSALARLARDPEAVSRAVHMADREAADPTSVDPNLAPLVVQVAAQFGDRTRFDRHVEIYKLRREKQASPQETNNYLFSFPAFEPPELVQAALNLLEDGTLPIESVGPVLRAMLNQNHTRLPAWEYIKSHWDQVHSISGMWVTFLVEATGNLPADRREDIVSFFKQHLQPDEAQMSLARALEMIDQLAEFKARVRDDLLSWFKTRS